MKYLCLVYLDENRLHELPDEDCVEYDASIRNSGHCIASEALQSVQTATTVRVRNGKMSITDGPFAETKEQLAGFYMIEARDLNEAIQKKSSLTPSPPKGEGRTAFVIYRNWAFLPSPLGTREHLQRSRGIEGEGKAF